jgi:hypothetical protein
MSSPLAIAAITAALKDLLNDGLLNHDLSMIGSFSVTALPPDRIPTGDKEPNQLNIFLYQVTSNSGWRNARLPSRDRSGLRVANAPLALDLHYVLTAYGTKDLNAEVLLGYAMHLLHENPVLTRNQLRTVLGNVSPVDGSILPGPFGNLSALDIADQVELIKITPAFLSSEELSKMWTAMQARYRPTMAYMASVVLIEGRGGEQIAPPVLQRGAGDSGPLAFGSPSPALLGVRPAASDLLPAARLGDDLLITGTNLVDPGVITVLVANAQLDIEQEIAPGVLTSATELTVHIPNVAEDVDAMNEWAVGLYALSLRVARPDSPVWTTNSVPVALSPRITVSPLNAPPGDIEITVTCAPRLRPGQEPAASLIFGTRQIAPKSITTPMDTTQPTTLVFTVPAVPAGDYLVRLRVQGIDSLPVTVTGSPAKLAFDPQQKVHVA